MHKLLGLVFFAALVLPGARAFSQNYNDHRKWDCGAVTLNSSGRWTYEDFGYGFRFELPSGWLGGQTSVHEASGPRDFLLEQVFALSDPNLHSPPGERRGPTEVINGLNWTALTSRTGSIGSYTYRDGVMVEFFGNDPVRTGNNVTVAPESLAALKEVQSSFTFIDGPYRTDRQLAALKVGQKLGGLTVTRIVSGAGGFDHPLATVKFAGQLTLTGNVVLPSPSMGGGWSPYFMYLDNESRSLVPQLKCPVEGLAPDSEWTFRVDFTNQEFTNQQFAQVPSISGSHAWYDAEATVVVDHVSEAFGNGGMKPQVSARLVRVLRKKETQ